MESNENPSSNEIIDHLSTSNDNEDPLNRCHFQMSRHLREILKFKYKTSYKNTNEILSKINVILVLLGCMTIYGILTTPTVELLEG